MSKAKVSTGILAVVMSKFNLGNEGKLGSFYDRELKKLQRSVQGQKKTIETLQFNLGVEVEKLNDKLEDAQQAVQDSWEAITPDDVATNALQDSFSSQYWYGIESAERVVTQLEANIEDITKQYEDKIEAAEKQITLLEARIAKITG